MYFMYILVPFRNYVPHCDKVGYNRQEIVHHLGLERKPAMKTTFTLTSPESKGISSEKIINFYRKLDEKNYPLHSALLYLNGALISKTYCAPFK